MSASPARILHILVLLVTMIVPISGLAEESRESQEDPKQVLREVHARMISGDIGDIKILNIPGDYHAGGTVTARYFEKVADYQLQMHVVESIYRHGLTQAVANTEATRHAGFPKLRWGIIFYDWKIDRVGSIYIDGTGETGVINTTPVKFVRQRRLFGLFDQSDLFSWLTGNFSPVFK